MISSQLQNIIFFHQRITTEFSQLLYNGTKRPGPRRVSRVDHDASHCDQRAANINRKDGGKKKRAEEGEMGRGISRVFCILCHATYQNLSLPSGRRGFSSRYIHLAREKSVWAKTRYLM
jgi:hypothetical protein